MRLKNVHLEDWLFAALRYQVLLLLLAFAVVPIVIVISTSIKAPSEFLAGTPTLIPTNFSMAAWEDAFHTMRQPLINSAFIATGTAILSLIITIPSAYVFARADFPGRKFVFYMILVALLFPYILLILPISDLWFVLGLYNTIPGIWLAYQVFVTPFAIWILRDFFEQMPPNLEEAAMMYGCSQLQAIYKIILPLSMPAIVATGFLAFLVGWNDFLFSNMLTTGVGPRPAVVTLFIRTSMEVHYWGELAANTLLIGLPPAVLYMVSRRYLSESFALSS